MVLDSYASALVRLWLLHVRGTQACSLELHRTCMHVSRMFGLRYASIRHGWRVLGMYAWYTRTCAPINSPANLQL